MKAHPAALAALAVVIIAAGTVAILYATGPGLPTLLGTSATTSTSSQSSASASESGTQASTTSATSSSTATQESEGQMALLITDPPIAPAGVTDLYMWYSGVSVHQAGTGPAGGWLSLNGSGVVELFQTVNNSLTIGSGQIPFGTYNAVRFSVTNGTVTYFGTNYTAYFRADDLTALVPGGIRVTANQTGAVLYDISPVVINWGTRANPTFLVTAKAVALPIPPSEVSRQTAKLGYRLAVGEELRHEAQEYTSRILVTNATLSTMGVSATVENTGNQSAVIRAIVVSPLTPALKAAYAAGGVPALVGSLTFVVNSTGQLTPLAANGMFNSQATPVFETMGYNLTVGATFTFTFSSVGSPIALGFGVAAGQAVRLVPGTQYIITVIGDQALSSIVVVAGG